MKNTDENFKHAHELLAMEDETKNRNSVNENMHTVHYELYKHEFTRLI